MQFAIGFLTGLITSVLIVVALAYFRTLIESKVSVIERLVESKGPQPKGFIIEPPDEADEIRSQIIERNNKQGRDTHISELQ